MSRRSCRKPGDKGKFLSIVEIDCGQLSVLGWMAADSTISVPPRKTRVQTCEDELTARRDLVLMQSAATHEPGHQQPVAANYANIQESFHAVQSESESTA